MELLNRYLQAVKWWLPRDGQADILRELSEDLHSQIEAKKAELDRNLTDSEIAELLKRHGNPFLVASRFRTDHEWIGAPWLQLYQFILKIVLLWVLIPILAIVYVPTIAAARNPASALLSASAHIWLAIVYAVGMVTLGFGALRWFKPDLWSLKEWDPLRLPPARDPLKISRLGSALEAFISLIFLSWWMDMPHVVLNNYAVKFGGRWQTPTLWIYLHGDFYWLICAIVTGAIAVSIVSLIHPTWTRTRMKVRSAIDGITAATMFLVLGLDWKVVSMRWTEFLRDGQVIDTLRPSQAVNMTIGMTLFIIGSVSAWTCISRWKQARNMSNSPTSTGIFISISS